MDDNQQEDLGKYARHPLRTAGMAFVAGTMVGMSMLGAKKSRNKSPLHKFIDQMGL